MGHQIPIKNHTTHIPNGIYRGPPSSTGTVHGAPGHPTMGIQTQWLPSGYVNGLLLKTAIEIVDFPIKNFGDFQ